MSDRGFALATTELSGALGMLRRIANDMAERIGYTGSSHRDEARKPSTLEDDAQQHRQVRAIQNAV